MYIESYICIQNARATTQYSNPRISSSQCKWLHRCPHLNRLHLFQIQIERRVNVTKGITLKIKKLCVHRGGGEERKEGGDIDDIAWPRRAVCAVPYGNVLTPGKEEKNERNEKKQKMLGRYETVPCHFILYSVYCVSRRIVTRKETKGRWRAPALDITCLKGSTYILEADTKYRRDGLCCITSIVMYLWCYYILSHLIK